MHQYGRRSKKNCMKILYFTDVHATGKSPQSRIDSFPVAIKNKLNDVKEMIIKHNVNLVIIGGDLFHTDVVANKFASDIIKIMKSWNKTIYVVPGNHDISGYNLSTLEHSTLGILESSGVIKTLTRKTPIIGTLGGIKIAIEGQEYCVDIDKEPSNYNKKIQADFNILFAHGMLQPKPILNSISHVVIKDIPEPADITFCGHDHVGWGCIENNGKYFFNCGCVGRVDCSVGMRKHIPCVLLIDINSTDKDSKPNVDIQSIPFPSAKPFDEVFDVTKISKTDNIYKNSFTDFVNMINNSKISNKLDQLEYIDEMLKDGLIDNDISESCKSYIEDSKKNIGSTNITSYNKIADNIYIKSIALKNFMSHKDSIIEFDSGFNAILGSNNAGKSSILTALNWVLYDTPKGIDFLRTGSKTCEVKVTFSNGTYIRKTKNKNNGAYYVFDNTSSDEKVFKGYGNNLPMDIVNVHQMPKVSLYKDKEISLNYGSQLEGIFLVNASSSEKAEALGKLTGADIIDNAISNVATDLREVDKKYKTLTKENKVLIEDKDKALTVLDKHTEVVKEYNNALGRLKNDNAIVTTISKMKKTENSILSLKQMLSSSIQASSKLSESNAIFDESFKILSSILCIKKTKQEINSIAFNLSKEKEIVKKFSNKDTIVDTVTIEKILSYTKEKATANKIKNDLIKLKENIKHLPTCSEDVKIIYSIKEYVKIVDEINKLSCKLNFEKNNIDKLMHNINDINANIKKLYDYLHENGVCPTCNRTLDEKSLNFIMNK